MRFREIAERELVDALVENTSCSADSNETGATAVFCERKVISHGGFLSHGGYPEKIIHILVGFPRTKTLQRLG